MLLVGSKALEHYIPNLGRATHDWDIWMSIRDYEYFKQKYHKNLIKETSSSSLFEINNEIFEIKHEEQFEPTDRMIFDNFAGIFLVSTPIGLARVPSIQNIYDMKKATALYIDEPKHKYDLELIKAQFTNLNENTEIFKWRAIEIETRVTKSKKVKYDFFHKYHIPEYIYHDELHSMIADLLDITIPTYQRITTAETNIAENLFNNLTHEQKISLMVEESLVLCLERWFNPQMVENGINYRLIDMFYSNNEGLPTYNILKHCCITGLKGEAGYITSFARENFFEIEKEWQKAKSYIKEKGGFPSHFFDKLFILRDEYKAGKKVAIT